MNPPQRSGPVALVTGGAVRVGEAISRALAAAGYRVWVHHHRSTKAAAHLADSVEGVVGAPRADLCDPEARARLIDAVCAPSGPAGGRLDLLVNNAASFERGRFLDRSDSDLARTLALLLVAPLSLARRAHPALAGRAGCIVNITDRLARAPSPGYCDHGIAKAGLEAATAALALELAPVRVCAVAPGTVAWAPDLSSHARAALTAQTALGRIATPADVAAAVLFLASTPSMTGATVVVDAGQAVGAGQRPAS